MAITVTQAWDAVDLELEQGKGTHSSSAATVHYIVTGTSVDTEACTAAYTAAPEEYCSIHCFTAVWTNINSVFPIDLCSTMIAVNSISSFVVDIVILCMLLIVRQNSI